MSLGELIKILEAEDPEKVVPFGFHDPHSYRGYYDELGFEPTRNVTVASMLADCRGALGATFTGYKGGEFTMTEHTRCWLAMWGQCSDNTLGPELLRSMLAGTLGMSLGWSDAYPVATCTCGARFIGDSLNDTVLGWAKHVTSAHREDW